MTQRTNKVPAFYWGDDTIVPGTRILVRTQRGTFGTGTVTAILRWVNTPDTICAEMDPDTQYATSVRPGWEPDQKRIPDIGLFGGEIAEVLKMH